MPPPQFCDASPFPGGDLEQPGVLEKALSTRASSTREIIFLSVGDTRDHRRQYKDPALKNISVDFILNLLANLRRLGLDHFLILTTQSLCRQLQRRHCLHACAWTTLWNTHPGLPVWSIKPGDMFLMWEQQWHYVSRALTMGYSVLRADTDVYFAEDPYPILHGPLMRPFHMIVQQDFGGPLGTRPACHRVLKPRHSRDYATGASSLQPIGSCGVHRGTALLNIGLVYVRAPVSGGGGGGALPVINGTWSRFLHQLGQPRNALGRTIAGPQNVEALIDQPLMRAVVSELSVQDVLSQPRKPKHAWTVVPGGAEEVYAGAGQGLSSSCALQDPIACARVAAERSKTAFLAQIVKPSQAGGRAERIALAPDWLFGRGCLVHVRAPLALLHHATPNEPPSSTVCRNPPTGWKRAPPAPGPAAGLLVATHFVYSMALKRQRSFRAFGWDLSDTRPRTNYTRGEACWKRSHKGMLFSHTFFAQTEQSRAVLCAMPSGDGPECSCCVGLQSLKVPDGGGRRSMRGDPSQMGMETTGGHRMPWIANRAAKLTEGCTDYQAFWD